MVTVVVTNLLFLHGREREREREREERREREMEEEVYKEKQKESKSEDVESRMGQWQLKERKIYHQDIIGCVSSLSLSLLFLFSSLLFSSLLFSLLSSSLFSSLLLSSLSLLKDIYMQKPFLYDSITSERINENIILLFQKFHASNV